MNRVTLIIATIIAALGFTFAVPASASESVTRHDTTTQDATPNKTYYCWLFRICR